MGMTSSGIPALDQALSGGYPEKSSVLVIGQPGIGKEALGYWFTRAGLVQGDYCLYVTHRSVSDVVRDMVAYGVPADRIPDWIAGSGGQTKCELSDYTSLSFNIKQAVLANAGRRIRVVTDVISPLLIMNPQPTVYQYLSNLLKELKQSNSVVLALVEDGMHSDSTVAALEQQFDGVIELKLYEEGLSITPLLRVRKMLGLAPQLGYFRFAFSKIGMEVLPYVR
jgi:KaiC/GvpD/RAD55 family RecA-like ATPase